MGFIVMQLMNELHQDHQQISVLLTILKNKIATLENGARPNFPLMAEVVDYLLDYAGSFHHEKEDVLYCYLQQHYPVTHAAVQQQLQEHQQLADMTIELQQSIEAVLVDAPVSLGSFGVKLQRFIDKQQQHLSLEENKIFPLALRTLSRDDWRVLQSQLPRRHDPLAAGAFKARYAHLAQALIEDLA